MRLRDIVLTASAVALIAAPAAIAHSGLRSTSPKAGSVVKALPAKVVITFKDRLLRVTSVRVLDRKGVNHVVWARLDRRNAARVVVRTRKPVPGAYKVLWKVQAEDGHSEAGTFRFRARGPR
ncbi:MAG: copper resistance protein CopC [Thermoleophilia bacterium]|nr:copper resistance protein CopC [Thermoleophilia bacterium]